MEPLKRLRLIEKESQNKYPMPGEPVECVCLDYDESKPKVHNQVTRHLPHVRLSKNEGIFLNYWVEDSDRAWEISMQKAAELRGFGKI